MEKYNKKKLLNVPLFSQCDKQKKKEWLIKVMNKLSVLLIKNLKFYTTCLKKREYS